MSDDLEQFRGNPDFCLTFLSGHGIIFIMRSLPGLRAVLLVVALLAVEFPKAVVVGE